jgi:hypothetical protein
MSDKTPKSPQEKKSLSLERDRRNTYGNNQKAARKAIPLRKAWENRRNRHKNNQDVSQIDRLDEVHADLVESSARNDIYRTGGWTKRADTALGEVIARSKSARLAREGRKLRSRFKYSDNS